jgi:uncharacterized protein (UPF0248 family)
MGECRHREPEKAFAMNRRLIDVPYPREILNRLKWKEGSLNGVNVTYVHRGAPGDSLTILAKDITTLGHSFFITADGQIPYHRIILIERGGEILFDIKEFENKDTSTT